MSSLLHTLVPQLYKLTSTQFFSSLTTAITTTTTTATTTATTEEPTGYWVQHPFRLSVVISTVLLALIILVLADYAIRLIFTFVLVEAPPRGGISLPEVTSEEGGALSSRPAATSTPRYLTQSIRATYKHLHALEGPFGPTRGYWANFTYGVITLVVRLAISGILGEGVRGDISLGNDELEWKDGKLVKLPSEGVDPVWLVILKSVLGDLLSFLATAQISMWAVWSMVCIAPPILVAAVTVTSSSNSQGRAPALARSKWRYWPLISYIPIPPMALAIKTFPSLTLLSLSSSLTSFLPILVSTFFFPLIPDVVPDCPWGEHGPEWVPIGSPGAEKCTSEWLTWFAKAFSVTTVLTLVLAGGVFIPSLIATVRCQASWLPRGWETIVDVDPRFGVEEEEGQGGEEAVTAEGQVQSGEDFVIAEAVGGKGITLGQALTTVFPPIQKIPWPRHALKGFRVATANSPTTTGVKSVFWRTLWYLVKSTVVLVGITLVVGGGATVVILAVSA